MAERLARQGVRQRLLVQPGTQAPDLPGAEVATISGYDDAEPLAAALAGVGTLLLIPVKEHPQRVRLHTTAVDAALAAGVSRIVYSSFLGAAADATFTFARDHYATEQHVRSSGVAFTFLRGSPFLEVVHYLIGADGVIRGPAGDGRLAPVARDDLAEVAAAVLVAGGTHDRRTLDVTGPQCLSLRQVAEAFTRRPGGRSATWTRRWSRHGPPGTPPAPRNGWSRRGCPPT